MNDTTSYIRNMIRQIFVLMAIVGLTFAAGINWAEAATPHTTAGASPLPVVLIFIATIALAFGMMIKSKTPARIRARTRPANRRR